MVYRETENTRARQEAKRELILSSALAVIGLDGEATVTMETIAAKAGVASGLMYRYFPDKHELLASAAQILLVDRDLVAMRRRANDLAGSPLQALAASIAAFFGNLRNGHLVRFRARSEIHTDGMRRELARLIQAAELGHGPKDGAMAAASALGAIYGLCDANGPTARNNAPAATLFILRGIGVNDREARKVLAKAWGSDVTVLA